MANYQSYSSNTDEELINMVITSPDAAEGITAKEILEYRKYLVAKRQNTLIVIFTIIMALSTAIDICYKLFASNCPK